MSMAAGQEASAASGGRDKRRFERVPFVGADVALFVIGARGDRERVPVETTDLSAGGMCITHRRFLHPGTRLELELTDLMGRQRVLAGVIAWCDYFPVAKHMSGVKFDESIDPRQMIDAKRLTEVLADRATARVERAPGTVLTIDDEVLDRELLKMYLSDARITARMAGNSDEAYAILEAEPVDLVLCDLTLGSERGEDVIAGVRERGFAGPVVVITSESDRERLGELQRIGVAAVVSKPYDAPALLRLLNEHLSKVELPLGEGPIYSELEQVLQVTGPVKAFVAASREKLAELSECVEQDDLSGVRAIIKTLHATGAGYGFSIVTEAAHLALRALDSSFSIHESRGPIRRLMIVLERLAVRSDDQPRAA